MHSIARLDLSTLYACHLLVCAVAGIAFLLVHTSVKVPGLRWVAANFFLDTIFLALMLSRFAWQGESLPVMMSDASLLLANYTFYIGFCLVMGLRPHLTWIRVLFGLSVPVLLYFTAVKYSVSLRWIVILLVTALMHLLLATQAARHREGLLARKLFASIEFLTAAGALYQGLVVILHPMAEHSSASAPAQTMALFIQLSHVFGVSICGFMAAYARATAEAEQSALQDALPGVLNRKGIELALIKYLGETHLHESPLVVALIDLDHFKRINDSHGHPAGDAALAYLAQALTERLRPSDYVGRFGGDEFLIVMPSATASYAHQLLEAVRIEVSGRPDLPFTFSCGGTTAGSGDTAKTVVKRADDILYRVKRSGRNRVLVERGGRTSRVTVAVSASS